MAFLSASDLMSSTTLAVHKFAFLDSSRFGTTRNVPWLSRSCISLFPAILISFVLVRGSSSLTIPVGCVSYGFSSVNSRRQEIALQGCAWSCCCAIEWTRETSLQIEKVERTLIRYSMNDAAHSVASRNSSIWTMLYLSFSESSFLPPITILDLRSIVMILYRPSQSPMRFSVTFSPTQELDHRLLDDVSCRSHVEFQRTIQFHFSAMLGHLSTCLLGRFSVLCQRWTGSC